MITVKRGFADTPEGQVHYRVSFPVGAPAGDPIVLGHWSPSSGRRFEAVLPLLAERGYVAYAPDLMGLGDSDKPAFEWGVAEYAANLGHLLDALDITRVNLVGGHTSAASYAELALRHPERVQMLVMDGCPVWSAEERATKTGPSPLVLADDGSHMLDIWRHARPRPTIPLDQAFAQATDIMKAGFTAHLALKALFAYDLEAVLPRITVPTVVFSATEDPIHYLYEKAVSLIPGGRGHVFPGRAPVLEPSRAAEWVEVLDSFLSG